MAGLPSKIRPMLKPSSRCNNSRAPGVYKSDHTPKQLDDLSNLRKDRQHTNTDVKPVKPSQKNDKQLSPVESNPSNVYGTVSFDPNFRIGSHRHENAQGQDRLASPVGKDHRSDCSPKEKVITARDRVGDRVDSEETSGADNKEKKKVACEIKKAERKQQMVKCIKEINELKVQESVTYVRGSSEVAVEVAEEGLELDKRLQRQAVHQRFVYFWLEYDVFSQWYPSSFNVDGIEFRFAEQFMMFKKADMFGDTDTVKKVLNSNSPRRIKQLGRQVKGFNYNFWESQCLYYVKQGNMAKFSQNKSLKDKLFETHPKILVEASPFDKIWGIGLCHDDPLACDQRTWQGRNWLGYVLTEVRDELMYEADKIKENEKQVYIATLMADLTSRRERDDIKI